MLTCTQQMTHVTISLGINEFISGKRCLPYVPSNILQHVSIELDQVSYFYQIDQMCEPHHEISIKCSAI